MQGKGESIQGILDEELDRCKRVLGVGSELRVRWLPNGSRQLSGEVRGKVILIYEEDEQAALETLKHEYLDWAISQVIDIHSKVTNKLISLINEEAYGRKERLVDSLATLI